MTYRVEFWTRDVNVIEVEAGSREELYEKCDEMLYSAEHNYIWDNATVENSGWDFIGEVEGPEKWYEVSFIDGHDLKYKTRRLSAESASQAVKCVWDLYGSAFEHRLVNVKEVTA